MGCAESKSKQDAEDLASVGRIRRRITEERWEFEGFYLKEWKPPKKLHHKHFSSVDGSVDRSVVLLPEGWDWQTAWEWTSSDETDVFGWQYSVSFNKISKWLPDDSKKTFVRRRKHERIRVSLEETELEELPKETILDVIAHFFSQEAHKYAR